MTRPALTLLLALLPIPTALGDEPDNDGIVDVDFGEWAFDVPEVAEPAMQLTASDGTGLAMTGFAAKAVVQGPVAYTELHLTFHNPEDRVREGRFEITLPPGAAISRFAMNIEGQWQEGEVVETQLARRAYEDFLHRRQDPALLETDGGNQFRARVFPIPAGADKELILSYSQELVDADGLYRLPTAGLSTLNTFDVDVSIETVGRARETLSFHRERTAPEGDVVVATGGPQAQIGVRHDDLAMARVVPRLRETPVDLGGLTVLFDTSASRSLGLADSVARLQDALSALVLARGDLPVRVVAFDQTSEVIYEGQASGFGRDAVRRLLDRGAFGASDLAAALRQVRTHDRLLLVTDGVVTAGNDDLRDLSALVVNAGNRGVIRVDVLAMGGIRDDAALRRLATVLGQPGTVMDHETSGRDIARRLLLDVVDLPVSVAGAEWVWPTVLRGVQPGEARTVFADVPGGRLDIQLAGQSVGPIAMADVDGPLLEREWVQARMDRLLAMADDTDDTDIADAYRGQVTALSIANRVLTPTTAMLVLETEADYVRFGIDRNALSDVLIVEDGALAAVTRTGRTGGWVGQRDRVPMPMDAPTTLTSGDSFGDMEQPMEDAAMDAVMSESEERSPPMREERSRRARSSSAVTGASSGESRPGPVSAAAPAPSPPPPLNTRDGEQMQDPAPQTASSPGGAVLLRVQERIAAGDVRSALGDAKVFVAEHPGDVLGLLALGEALQASGDITQAARVYGSIIDLFPSRADMRRMAGERLDALDGAASALALDTYRTALEQRPDHPSSHRQLAWAQVRVGAYSDAFTTLESALQRAYPGGRFAGVDRVVREDLALVGAAWVADEPGVRSDVQRRLSDAGTALADQPSLRFVVTWETDANDVDLHVYDAKGGHAWYSDKQMPSGGELFADVTTGFGPECFAVNGKTHGPYRIQAHYYRQGPMGYGMGTLHIVRHDGEGKLSIEDRPFVVQSDGAWIELGQVAG